MSNLYGRVSARHTIQQRATSYLASVKAPPRKGPITEDTPKARPKKPVKTGRLRSGTIGMIIWMPPPKIPAAPAPATARPAIKAPELGAAPHIADPISKNVMKARKTHFVGYSW